MDTSPITKLLGTYVVLTCIVVSVFVSPWNSMDPINLPKLTLLGIFSMIAFSLSLSQGAFVRRPESRFLIILLLLFILQLSIALFASPGDLAFHLYGTPGRNTGFFTYLFLSFLLFSCAVSSSHDLLRKFTFSFIGVGGLLSLYGLGQSWGFDFFDYVNVYSSSVFGTFGNPNFQSAFMGMTAAGTLTMAIFGQVSRIYRISFAVICVIAFVNIKLSSEQGFLNFLAGFAAAILVYLFTKKQVYLAWSFLAFLCSGGILVLAGILNIGLLADQLYKSSLQSRAFYWQAAFKMMAERPFFGVGLDGFGDWYRRTRPQSAIDANASVVSDSAHNIPLDIGSGGGIPLLILYLAFLGLVLNAVIKVINRREVFDPIFASIVAIWIAYQAQTLISINQLGLGVWGWSLTGLLIGYELNTRNKSPNAQTNFSRKVRKEKGVIPANALLFAIASASIGCAISIPPYLASSKYFKALQSSNSNLIFESAYLKPYDRTRFLFTAQILAENKLETQAIKILSDASTLYPDNFELWQRWSKMPSASPAQIAKAKAEMKRLDPFNPELK